MSQAATHDLPQSMPEDKPKKGLGYIVSPTYDTIFFILAPLIALLLVFTITSESWVLKPQNFFGLEQNTFAFFIAVWTNAHLIAVAFRSHANPEVFNRFRLRFTAVPVVLFVGLMASEWLLAAALVLAVFWDVYHTSMQNFGFCRIYDAKQGNPRDKGRSLDLWLNHFLYIGPIIVGVNLMPHLSAVTAFRRVGWETPAAMLMWIEPHRTTINAIVLGSGTLLLIAYVVVYYRWSREGYHISRHKIALMVSTGLVCGYSWTFLGPGRAFFVANFYHALQYFAIVWSTERKNISKIAGGGNKSWSRPAALILFLVVSFSIGTVHYVGSELQVRWILSFGLVIALMHFWYDGFVWSVRKGHV